MLKFSSATVNASLLLSIALAGERLWNVGLGRGGRGEGGREGRGEGGRGERRKNGKPTHMYRSTIVVSE